MSIAPSPIVIVLDDSPEARSVIAVIELGAEVVDGAARFVAVGGQTRRLADYGSGNDRSRRGAS